MEPPHSTKFPENRLSKEKSPYLLQHKNNPVDWYPWGEEAFKKARVENKPIFLSVGYSTCHWCHVMAHESFENPEIAAIMNKYFVNIKLDREERPDIDKIYMTYVQALSGGGGWPMSVWLTPKLNPIFGATYFPPKDQYGRPGFPSVLTNIAKLWATEKEDIEAKGHEIVNAIRTSLEKEKTEKPIELDFNRIFKTCFQQIARGFDEDDGGFSSAPKFPRPSVFFFLHRFFDSEKDNPKAQEALHMSSFTLRKMGEGGIFDHIGGGFHRYSVTTDWHIPHYEKMLYDQGQLAVAFLEMFQMTKDSFFKDKAKSVLDYVLRDMTSPWGGFYSAEDADSIIEHGKPEHAEGAFYVWTYEELQQILGEHASLFNYHYGVLPKGNAAPGADPHGELRGKNTLIQRHPLEETAKKFSLTTEQAESILKTCREQLFEIRNKRPRPHLDDKIITAWNGLMISAFAKGYQVFADTRYLEAAQKAATFIGTSLFSSSTGTLIRNFRAGEASSIEAFTDDYSFYIQALLDLYEASFDVTKLQFAEELQKKQDQLFWDANHGGYYFMTNKDESLIMRMKEEYDGAEPSNNSVSALNLLRLAQFTNESKYRDQAMQLFNSVAEELTERPFVIPQMCGTLFFARAKPKQIVIAGSFERKDVQDMLHLVNQDFIPNKSLMLADGGSGQQYLAKKLPFLEGMKPLEDKATAFVCENFTCTMPVNSVEKLAHVLHV